MDFISKLNDVCQRRNIEYKFIVIDSNSQYCELQVAVDGHKLDPVRAVSKKDAKHLAAKQGLKFLHERKKANSLKRGLQANFLGLKNENLVCEILNAGPCPDWFISATKSSKDDDRRGIDVVVKTADLGNLFLQIKSSTARAIAYSARKRSYLVGVIIISNLESNTDLLNRIILALNDLREKVLNKRLSVSLDT